jgi:hypothetical protein
VVGVRRRVDKIQARDVRVRDEIERLRRQIGSPTTPIRDLEDKGRALQMACDDLSCYGRNAVVIRYALHTREQGTRLQRGRVLPGAEKVKVFDLDPLRVPVPKRRSR